MKIADEFVTQLLSWQLIMDKVDVKNPKSNSGWTPLHSAARAGHLNICRL